MTNENQAVGKLRELASKMKANKTIAASRVIESVSTLRDGAAMYVHVLKAYADMMQAGVEICEAVLNKPELRTQVTTLTSNVVSDLANRVNELANIVDSASKERAIRDACGNLKNSIEGVGKGIVEILSRRRSHLTPVS